MNIVVDKWLHSLSITPFFRALYKYGDEAPCYIAPKMLEEALETDLRSFQKSFFMTMKPLQSNFVTIKLKIKDMQNIK